MYTKLIYMYVCMCVYAADAVCVSAGDDVRPARQGVGAVVAFTQDEVAQHDSSFHGQDQHTQVDPIHTYIHTYIHTCLLILDSCLY